MREVFSQKAFDPYRGDEMRPGAHIQADAQIDDFVREKVDTTYHPCGSCKMGADEMAVVDGYARVHGVEALRVVDASIMPDIVSGNINAPTIMMAEKVADIILGSVYNERL